MVPIQSILRDIQKTFATTDVHLPTKAEITSHILRSGELRPNLSGALQLTSSNSPRPAELLGEGDQFSISARIRSTAESGIRAVVNQGRTVGDPSPSATGRPTSAPITSGVGPVPTSSDSTDQTTASLPQKPNDRSGHGVLTHSNTAMPTSMRPRLPVTPHRHHGSSIPPTAVPTPLVMISNSNTGIQAGATQSGNNGTRPNALASGGTPSQILTEPRIEHQGFHLKVKDHVINALGVFAYYSCYPCRRCLHAPRIKSYRHTSDPERGEIDIPSRVVPLRSSQPLPYQEMSQLSRLSSAYPVSPPDRFPAHRTKRWINAPQNLSHQPTDSSVPWTDTFNTNTISERLSLSSVSSLPSLSNQVVSYDEHPSQSVPNLSPLPGIPTAYEFRDWSLSPHHSAAYARPMTTISA
jgi:hypothetical protein